MSSAESHSSLTACHQSVLLFYYGLDRGDYALAMEQIAPKCLWERGGVLLRDRQQIEESLRKRSATQVARHIVNNFALLKQDDESATAVYCLTVHLYDSGSPASLPVPGSTPFLLADISCELARESDHVWRIRELDIQRTFTYARELTTPFA